MSGKWLLIMALSAGLGFAGVQAVSAEEAEHHHEGKGEAVEAMPSTVGGIWGEVKEHEEELGKIIADKQLDKVHEVAFEIRDYVNALAGKSANLPADKRTKVTANAKYVTALATRLDESGDARDQTGTEANFKKLQGLLSTIEAQYPAAALSAGKGADDNKAAIVYTCPMHPEVLAAKPGKCPKCGMNLVVKK